MTEEIEYRRRDDVLDDVKQEYDYPDRNGDRRRIGSRIHENHTPRRNTDYDLPESWGLMDDERKSEWFLRERVFRQACRQDTSFGRRYRAVTEDNDTHDTGVSLFQALNRCDKYGGDYRVE